MEPILDILTDVQLVRLAIESEYKYRAAVGSLIDERIEKTGTELVEKSGVVNRVVHVDRELLRRQLWPVLTACKLDVQKAQAFLDKEYIKD